MWGRMRGLCVGAALHSKGSGFDEGRRSETNPLPVGVQRDESLCPPEAHPHPIVANGAGGDGASGLCGEGRLYTLKGSGFVEGRRSEANPLPWECRGTSPFAPRSAPTPTRTQRPPEATISPTTRHGHRAKHQTTPTSQYYLPIHPLHPVARIMPLEDF